MSKILIVDDELNIRELVKKYATFENFDSDTASNGLEAIEKVKNNRFDLIVMDIMMPELDGFSAVKEIRKFSDVPIIMLSARTEEYDKLYGFDLGIDDYVTKPFSPKELMMRISAILNRYSNKQNQVEETKRILEYNGLIINLSEHSVYVNKNKIDLTLKEYELLVYLMENMNVALKRESILEKIWGSNDHTNERTLDTHIKSMRKKIGEYADNIITIRRVGYRFEKR